MCRDNRGSEIKSRGAKWDEESGYGVMTIICTERGVVPWGEELAARTWEWDSNNDGFHNQAICLELTVLFQSVHRSMCGWLRNSLPFLTSMDKPRETQHCAQYIFRAHASLARCFCHYDYLCWRKISFACMFCLTLSDTLSGSPHERRTWACSCTVIGVAKVPHPASW